jgi:hypothetical protein
LVNTVYAQRRAWSRGENLAEPEEVYDGIRELLAPQYADLPAEQLDARLGAILGEMSPDDLENFWQSVKRFGQKALPVLQRALPVVQTALPLVGGPLGGLAAGALGAIQTATRRPTTTRVPAPPAGAGIPVPEPVLPPAAGGGSPAAAQLLQLINRPEVQQALLAMVMGQAGARNVSAGDTPLPVAAVANTVGVLANQAAAEYHRVVSGEGGGTPLYLLDNVGEFVCDVANPAGRAEVVLARFAAADAAERVAAEDEDRAEDENSHFDALAELNVLYDELELAELAEEED